MSLRSQGDLRRQIRRTCVGNSALRRLLSRLPLLLLVFGLYACSSDDSGTGGADAGNTGTNTTGTTTTGDATTGTSTTGSATGGSATGGSTSGTDTNGSTTGATTGGSGTTGSGTTGSGTSGTTSSGTTSSGTATSGTTTSGASTSGSTTGGGAPVDSLTAVHRNGQTFLTWPEVNTATRYHVYRHNSPINAESISSATRLTGKWGSLGPDTSRNRHGSANVPANFVINDLGSPLDDSTGLFVYTVPSSQQGNYYYAVTTVVNGNENINVSAGNNSLSNAVNEQSGTPRPILVSSINGGKGRIYQQYMDYENWNPTFNGYAYDFGVTLPHNYNSSRSYPVQLKLHAFGESYRNLPETEFDWEIIQVSPIDPGQDQNSRHSWWYGYATDHNYQTTDLPPSQGTVTNFTEQRVLAAVRFVLNASDINSNSQLTHIVGSSMGASGALSLAIRYPNVFSGIYAGQPMTDYPASPTFQENFVALWGQQQSNLPIVNAGPDSGSISRFSVGQSAQTGVWDWMDHFEQLKRRSGEDFGFLMIDHGKADRVIDWDTQGRPLSGAFTEARVGYTANAFGGVGHTWLAFGAVINSMFGLGFDTLAPWRYPLALSYPAIHNATGSSSINPGASGDDSYNMNIEWSTAANAFDSPIVDLANRYEITLRSTAADQTADITPRRTQQFKPTAGRQCSWTAVKLADGTSRNGSSTVSGNRLLTVTGVPVYAGRGTRLTINC
jgi:pimeloyl-ACP methyl ester carboxylesterase